MCHVLNYDSVAFQSEGIYQCKILDAFGNKMSVIWQICCVITTSEAGKK